MDLDLSKWQELTLGKGFLGGGGEVVKSWPQLQKGARGQVPPSEASA